MLMFLELFHNNITSVKYGSAKCGGRKKQNKTHSDSSIAEKEKNVKINSIVNARIIITVQFLHGTGRNIIHTRSADEKRTD